MPDQILTPAELQPAVALANKTLEQLDRILLGRRELLKKEGVQELMNMLDDQLKRTNWDGN